MRRFWVGVLLVSFGLLSATAGAWAASSSRKMIEVEYSDLQIMMNDQAVAVDAEPFLYLEKGRVFAPVRHMAEAMGNTVLWDGASGTVKIYTPDYVSATPSGQGTRFYMPAQGFSVTAPTAFQAQRFPGLLMMLVDPSSGGTFMVTRIPPESGALGEQMEQVLAGMEMTTFKELTVASTSEAEGGLSVTGTALLNGQKAIFTVRILASETGNVVLTSVVSSETAMAAGPPLAEVMDSFTWE